MEIEQTHHADLAGGAPVPQGQDIPDSPASDARAAARSDSDTLDRRANRAPGSRSSPAVHLRHAHILTYACDLAHPSTRLGHEWLGTQWLRYTVRLGPGQSRKCTRRAADVPADPQMGNNGGVTTATTAGRATGPRAKLDQICADAVDLARDAVTEDVAGPYVEVVAEGERLVTHYFECLMPGYRGWRWAVTVARVARSKHVTVCETVLLPGPDALVAPPWVPWEERVAPGDLGVGDLMPTPSDDERLAPGYLLSDDPAVEDVVWELGLGRVRVMSRDGRLDTADRWYDGDHGPYAPIATAAPGPARCVSCGFYLPLAGAMRATFGVCGNMYAPDDGRVVSGDHGCGAHSEVLLDQPNAIEELPTIYDDAEVDPVDVASESGVPAAAPARPAAIPLPGAVQPDTGETTVEPADPTDPGDSLSEIGATAEPSTEPDTPNGAQEAHADSEDA
jgi:hypothetical protein